MNLFIILFLSLVTIHIIIDFYCQPSSWLQDKVQRKYKSPKLVIHSMLHAMTACIPVLFITQSLYSIACLFLIVGISHWVIDLTKVYMEERTESNLQLFFADQILHITVLVLVAMHVSGIGLNFIENLGSIISPKNIAILLTYILIFKPASILIGIVLQKYEPEEISESNGLRSGGEMIGYLERLLILTFIIIGQYAVIGFILAAKSIFRFGELNNAKSHNLTEYVLLGSFLSVTITAILGIFAKLLS